MDKYLIGLFVFIIILIIVLTIVLILYRPDKKLFIKKDDSNNIQFIDVSVDKNKIPQLKCDKQIKYSIDDLRNVYNFDDDEIILF